MSNGADPFAVCCLSLNERIERAKARVLEESPQTSSPEMVAALKGYWADVLGGEEALRTRLRWEGLEESALPLIFDDAPDPAPGAHDWACFLGEVLAHFEGSTTVEPSASSGVPFGEVWSAFADVALRRLDADQRFGIPEGDAPSLAASAMLQVSSFMARRLSSIGSLVLFSDFDSHRKISDPQRAAQNTYSEWVAKLRTGSLREVMKKHPVLARSLATITLDAVDALLEWWERLSADWVQLRGTFELSDASGEISSLKLGLSDRHYRGRQAIAVTLSDGSRFVYKPKSMDLDAALADLLQRLSLSGGDSELFPAAANVLARSGYGWAKFVCQDSFATSTDVARYYRRCGSLLLLTYAFEGIDFTMDNIVASAGGPAAIDCETILQPLCLPFGAEAVRGAELEALRYRLLRERDFSVLDTGLLPSWQPSLDGGYYDISGIGGQQSYAASVQQEKWVGIGTSAMQMRRSPVAVTAEANAVICDGRCAPASGFTENIIEGFTSAYRLLQRWRDDPTHWLLPEMLGWADKQVRFLLRATGVYGRVLQRMLRPEQLTHPLFFAGIAEGLWKPFLRSESKPAIASFLCEEAIALQRLDIPCFHLAASGDDRSLFLAGPLDMALHRLEALCEDDLASQKRIIRACFSIAPRSKTKEISRDVLLQEAEEIARMMVLGDLEAHRGTALNGRSSPDAFGTQAGVAEGSSRDFFLYDGTIAGQVLFFAALAKVTSQEQHRARAIALLIKLRALTTGESGFAARAASLPLGAASGLASLAYTFMSASRLLQTDEWQADALSVVGLVTEALVKGDPHFDLLCGAAGAVMVFAGASKSESSNLFLDRAVMCGEYLLAASMTIQGVPGRWWRGSIGETYLGYGHGASGIAAALARLGAFAGMERFREASEEVFQALEMLFDGERGNWPVLVRANGKSHHQPMESLCHGAPGIALAAMDARKHGQSTDKVIEHALAVMMASPLHDIDTLCCGNMGRLEMLMSLKAIGATVPVEGLALSCLSRREACGIFRTSAKRSEQWTLPTGFYRGLSGIGYSLLRLGWEADIPSVASWD